MAFETERNHVNIDALARRGFLALEDQAWEEADAFFESVLNEFAECAEAYLGKFLVREKKESPDRYFSEQLEKTADAVKNTCRVKPGNEGYIIKNVKTYAIPGFFEESEIQDLYSFNGFEYESELACRTEQREQLLKELQDDRLFSKAVRFAEGEFKDKLEQTVRKFRGELDRRVERAKDADEISVRKIEREYARFILDTDGKVIRLSEEAQKRRGEEGPRETEKGEEPVTQPESLETATTEENQPPEPIHEPVEQPVSQAAEHTEKPGTEKYDDGESAYEKVKKKKTIFAIAIPAVLVCTAFVIVLVTVIIPRQKLDKAMGLMGAGDYKAAYALLEEIGKDDVIAANKYDRAMKLIESEDYEPACALLNGLAYKDSDEQLQRAQLQYPQKLLKKANVGDMVTFGSYEQDNNISNGKEDIEWRVLAKEDNKILVISDKALDCQPYNKSSPVITWKDCTLRKWLNDSFLNDAFNADEQAQILNTNVSAGKNPGYNTNPGNATTDKIFLLSITEAEKYFSNDEERKCAPTAYAKAQGAWTTDSFKTAGDEATCWWWLRSPGHNQYTAATVGIGGSVDYRGYRVDYDRGCVCPALWIDLDS